MLLSMCGSVRVCTTGLGLLVQVVCDDDHSCVLDCDFDSNQIDRSESSQNTFVFFFFFFFLQNFNRLSTNHLVVLSPHIFHTL
jgi:hypothetical protein